ncbi:MAG: hypothetical protein WCW68_01600 [Methanothrix sp.]
MLEGYKFANGELRKLTRPQIQFLNRFTQFKIDMKRGKKVSRGGGGSRLSGTPEQIHARMWPKIQAQKEAGLKSEIQAAQKVMRSWEEKHKGRQKKR